MSDASEAFTELFFGEGVYLGLLLYLTVIGLTALRVKYLGALYMPLSGLLALEYIQRATDENNLFWCAILMIISIPFLLINIFKGKSEL